MSSSEFRLALILPRVLARIIREALAGGVLVGEVGAKVPLAVP